MLKTHDSVVTIPEPAHIRSRLTDLATEANFLRALLRLLEKEGFCYAIRLKANPVLERKIAHLLKRPVGRPQGERILT